MKRSIYFLILIVSVTTACKKDKIASITQTLVDTPKVTSQDYIDRLLFVTKDNYQIQTSDKATFSSSDPNVTISSKGLISRLTSGEIAAIDIEWKNNKFPKTTIYALGATDGDQVEPAAYFHGETATDPYNNYVQGWKLLQTLPDINNTYVLVLRHADASFGRDWPSIHNPKTCPPDWWKSTDSLLARQLNTQGVQRATALGQIFRQLNFPIKRIFTSEFYRSRQTAQLIGLPPAPVIDPRINHMTHNEYAPGIFFGILDIVKKQPIDNQMTMIITHHPGNEPLVNSGYPAFPAVSAFNWSGSYFMRVNKDSTVTYAGAVTYGMFKYYRDLAGGH
jgi:phosphohistidine phosphatase SixA